MKTKSIIFVVLTSVIISASTAIGVYKFIDKQQEQPVTINQTQPVKFTNYPYAPSKVDQAIDFTYAASVTTPGVVHVTSKSLPKKTSNNYYNPFRDFFGDDFWGGQNHGMEPQPQVASGSGVIISPDGYIVTNNHVIRGADEIKIILNDNDEYTAEVIGSDASTDLALLKIDAENLPHIKFANSDSLLIGSWVLAVGNPFNLSSTVTAGIVSAKGRNINLLEGQSAIESFIQTDAAVNPGNSGGALVDISGNLVGINTAIASPTGAYAGYSFAVPSNLVRKVVTDLKEFGIVQRGFLGVTIRNIDKKVADDLDLDDLNGVYVEDVLEGSAADDAGIESEDVIKSINGIPVGSAPKLQEVVAQFRPGDKINVVYLRDGKVREADITLKNKNQGTEYLTKAKVEVVDLLGVEFTELSKSEKNDLGLTSGVKVSSIGDGKIRKYTDMREGFIITRIDKEPVYSVDDVIRILQDKKGGVMIEGVYSDFPGTYYYAFGL